jgi:cold-inducible RNA-binding protein
MGTKLYVGNLPFGCTKEELQDMFSEVGTVVSAQIVTDRETGRSRGFGFVEMSSQEEASAAVSRFDQTQMKGRPITVNEARPRTDRPERPGGGGRRDYGQRSY